MLLLCMLQFSVESVGQSLNQPSTLSFPLQVWDVDTRKVLYYWKSGMSSLVAPSCFGDWLPEDTPTPSKRLCVMRTGGGESDDGSR